MKLHPPQELYQLKIGRQQKTETHSLFLQHAASAAGHHNEGTQKDQDGMALPFIQLGVTSNSVVYCFDGDDFSVSHTMG